MKKEHGFSLVEIVVVIGIIGLLIGILVPNITGSFISNKRRATVIKAETLAKQLRVEVLAGNITIPTTQTSVDDITNIQIAFPDPDNNPDLVDDTSSTDGAKLKVNLVDSKICVYDASGELLYTEGS